MDESVIGPSGAEPSDATKGLAPAGPAVERAPEKESWPLHATDEAIRGHNAVGLPIKNRRWALVVDGVVQIIRHSTHAVLHPFSRSEMDGADDVKAVDVTNTRCELGYWSDDHGNMTPAGFIGKRLPPGQPAGHDLAIVPPITTAEASVLFSTTGLHAAGTDPEDMAEAQTHKVGFAAPPAEAEKDGE
jgi:hypothetical protein